MVRLLARQCVLHEESDLLQVSEHYLSAVVCRLLLYHVACPLHIDMEIDTH